MLGCGRAEQSNKIEPSSHAIVAHALRRARALMQDLHSMLPGTVLHDGSDAQAEAEALGPRV